MRGSCHLKKYFVNDKKVLNKVVSEDDKSFHVVLVPQFLMEYVLQQVHDVLGHNGTTRAYKYLKWLLERSVEGCQCSSYETMFKVQTAESAPSTLCAITLKCAIITNAFYCDGLVIGKLKFHLRDISMPLL